MVILGISQKLNSGRNMAGWHVTLAGDAEAMIALAITVRDIEQSFGSAMHQQMTGGTLCDFMSALTITLGLKQLLHRIMAQTFHSP